MLAQGAQGAMRGRGKPRSSPPLDTRTGKGERRTKSALRADQVCAAKTDRESQGSRHEQAEIKEPERDTRKHQERGAQGTAVQRKSAQRRKEGNHMPTASHGGGSHKDSPLGGQLLGFLGGGEPPSSSTSMARSFVCPRPQYPPFLLLSTHSAQRRMTCVVALPRHRCRVHGTIHLLLHDGGCELGYRAGGLARGHTELEVCGRGCRVL